ncbi:MAG: hypothetical protein ABI068_01595 [Ktedonobacterales bacterium]
MQTEPTPPAAIVPAPAPSTPSSGVFQLRRYGLRALIFYGVWCAIGYVLMFFGNAITDTVGLVVVFAEALLIYGIDREGLKTMNGLIAWGQLNSAQRWLLGIAEVIVFPLTLAVYLIRSILVARRYAPPARG